MVIIIVDQGTYSANSLNMRWDDQDRFPLRVREKNPTHLKLLGTISNVFQANCVLNLVAVEHHFTQRVHNVDLNGGNIIINVKNAALAYEIIMFIL